MAISTRTCGLLVVAGGLLAVTAGCRSIGGDAVAEGAAASTGTDTAVVNPCTAFSKADLQAYFNAPIVTVRTDQLVGNSKGCGWSTQDGDSTIDITTVTGAQAATAYEANTKDTDGKPGVPVSGVGDKAVRDPDDVWLFALKGDVFCQVTGQHDAQSGAGTGEIKGLEQFSMDDSVPASVADVEAQQLGTLCNRLFHSGNTTPNFAAVPSDGPAPASTQPDDPTVPTALPDDTDAPTDLPSFGTSWPSTFALPAGVSCGTPVKDGKSLSCLASVADEHTAYQFFLSTMPGEGYTIDSKSEESEGTTSVGSISFHGSGLTTSSNIQIFGKTMTIELDSN